MIINNKKEPIPLLKIIFAGTNEFSLQHLKTLIYTQRHKIVGIITTPDQPSGRGHVITQTPVKKIAKLYKIPIFQPKSLHTPAIHAQLLHIHADIIVVVAYGKIIPENILSIFPLGGINIHASLLPKWRGPSPIQSAIINGDKKTGITVIQMNKNIDDGNILYSIICPICFNETGNSLQKKLSKLGCKALLITLKKVATKTNHSIIQSQLVTYSKKIQKQDAQLLWTLDAILLERYIRAFNPWPICYFIFNQIQIKVWSATVEISKYPKYHIGEIITINKKGMQIQTKTNILNIKNIQLPGKKVMPAYNFHNTLNKFHKKIILKS